MAQIRPELILMAIFMATLPGLQPFAQDSKQAERERWARNEGIQEIIQLKEQEDYAGAFRLAQEVERWIPKDPRLAGLWQDISVVRTIESTPEAANVYLRDYRDVTGEWKYMGRTPISDIRIFRGLKRWRIEKEDFVTLDIARADYNEKVDSYVLVQEDKVPPEMVTVQGWTTPYLIGGLTHLKPVRLEDFLIDRYEVTNRQFKRFVENGGYRTQDYWKYPFLRDGKVLTWQEVMREFVDRTGRAGPSTWELGSYPPDQDQHPVRGISWYEAAAYAKWAEKSLPTVIHWVHASSPWFAPQIVPLSNLNGDGPVQVGKTSGISHFGSYDMAGNVKEWCWNANGEERYILGGAWDDPKSQFSDSETQSPFLRLPTYGFRCAKYLSPVPEAASQPLQFSRRQFESEKPVPEAEFESYRQLYSYEKSPLGASIDFIDDSGEYWIKQTVSFQAAYSSERVVGYLLLPKEGKPPYQAVVYFPPSNAFQSSSSQGITFEELEFIVKGGRAIFYPIYKGTYERKDELESDMPALTASYREHVIMWAQDLGRSIDYLESRPDIDGQKLAFFGYSAGAALGVILTAVEDRLKAGVLHSGGFHHQETFAEVDQFQFASRVRIPTLMLNGRYDFYFPVEKSQEPMFRALGVPMEKKRHLIFETGHTVSRKKLTNETLTWLDQYLGSVEPG